MTQYIRVKPTREGINTKDLTENIAALHNVEQRSDGSSGGLLNGLLDPDSGKPVFEFLITTGGKDTSIEFFYGVENADLETLEKRLIQAYPTSFDIERVDFDIRKKVITPEKYEPEEYVDQFESDNLLHNPETIRGSREDILGDHLSEEDSHLSEDDIFINNETNEVDDSHELPVLKESGSLEKAQPLVTKNAGTPIDDIPGPAWTEDGSILARPNLEEGTPIGIEWSAIGDRKKDWMTTISHYSARMSNDSEATQAKATLSNLIQHLSDVEHPLALQVLFTPMANWKGAANKRKKDLHLNKDSTMGKISHEIDQALLPADQKVRVRREQARDYYPREGETARETQSETIGTMGKRAEFIDSKMPHTTFRTTIRAVTVATRDQNQKAVKQSMHRISSSFDGLNGKFYHLNGKLVTNTKGRFKKDKASLLRHRLINRTPADWEKRSKERSSAILNADELCNFIAVPSSETLTAEGSRGTRAEARSRNPLPRPHPDLMEKFHVPGMRVGYSLDEEAKSEEQPTSIAPRLLPTHYLRAATTGGGKSKALINDILSLFENTHGPTILLDPKGDGMTQNYMRAHYERFGAKSLKDDVVHFKLPDHLPGFGFFNIEPKLRDGARRIDAIKNKAEAYEQILKLTMGEESYRRSLVAPTIIKNLIKGLFDKKHGKDRTGRTSSNKFEHTDLVRAADELKKLNDPNEEGGSIPEVEDDDIHNVLMRHARSDPKEFGAIINAVHNRLERIQGDSYLRRIFTNTDTKFDFRDHLDDDKVILFDLGDLSDGPTKTLTGLILTQLWSALQESKKEKCVMDHDSVDECREKAADPENPDCREPWGDDHVVNLIVDEAASVAVTDIMTTMLEQGRSFNLSLGLSMQFPEQMKRRNDERMYKNVLNNIATLLIGKITMDRDIAKAMAHENIDVEEFRNRIKSLPRGEWILQAPSPTFGVTGPEPISLAPLPIPNGHPESREPLEEQSEETFQHFLDNVIHQRVEDEYAVEHTEAMKERGLDEDDTIDRSDEKTPDGQGTSDDKSAEHGGSSNGSISETDLEESRFHGDRPNQSNQVARPFNSASAANDSSGGEDSVSLVGNISGDTSIEQRQQSSGNDTASKDIEASGNELSRNSENNIPNKKDTSNNVDSSIEANGRSQGDGGTTTDRPTANAPSATTLPQPSIDGAESASTKKSSGEPHPNQDAESTPEIDSSVTVATIPDLERAIEDWNLDSVLAVSSAVTSAFTEAGGELGLLRAVMSRIVEDAHSEGVTHTDGNPLTVSDLIAAKGKFAEAPLKIDVEALRNDPTLDSESAQSNETNTVEDGNEGPSADEPSSAVPEVSRCKLSREEIERTDYTQEDLDFLYTVVEAMNGDLDGYDLTKSMSAMARQCDVDTEALADDGLLKIHALTKNRTYYTVTTAGQKLCENTKHEGAGTGDRGGDTPHRVGAQLAIDYLERQDDVANVSSFTNLRESSQKKVDVIGKNRDGDITWVVEVESGKTAGEGTNSNNRVGINDYASIKKDYEELASAKDATALWVVRTKPMAARVLQILNSAQKTDIDTTSVNGGDTGAFNEEIIKPGGGDGMDQLLTFGVLRNKLRE